MNNFMLASRQRLRFASGKGQLTVEDLWSLPLTSLRKSANEINRLVNKSDDLFAAQTLSKEQKANELRLKIILEVIVQREADALEVMDSKEKEQRRKLLREIIAKKELEALDDQGLDALRKELDEI